MKDTILNFLADNYLIFMIVAIILLFALIGFIVDGKKKKQKNTEVVPATNVPPQPMPVNQNATVAPQAETVTPAPTMAAPVSEPSLSGLESTANDVTINTSEPVTPTAPVTPEVQSQPESIFNTPVSEPAVNTEIKVEEPTLVIEEPSAPVAPAPEVMQSVETPVAPAPEVMMPPIGETPSVENGPAIGETPSVGVPPVAPEPVVQEAAPVANEMPSVPVTPAPEAPQAPIGQ